MKWLAGVSAVLSAFLGIRKGKAARQDVKLRFWQIAVAALLLLACFIGGLLLLVSLVTR
ncbi:DUF2970 domain-containing protein [Pseudogulbenkiania ferrooxidans]|uniref:Transmembrane protein n=1 Tax=Pseudogulbenkiania ferrooxidans 2002 TaxID=279714 RepID=B9YYA1_9NEIS|nr:DUF2970 domain-containing protein [Pseudogulbenkiania ferrooxidans]EEG10104.1 conserved hypothetical protein [Pseudogulbenkiania ferrooxidans 2002]